MAALILLAASVAGAPATTARFGFTGFVIAYVVAAAAWVVARRAALPFSTIIAITIVFRALVLFAEPGLSNDVDRYMWDGRVLSSGANPYLRAPADSPGHERINHPEIRTIYPPHAQLLFAAVHELWLWKLLILGCDVAIVALLRSSPAAALAYATFPPAIFEGVWNGHIEIVAALLLVIAVKRRSAIATAVSVGLKISPIAALPALVLHSPHRLRFMAVFALVLIVPAIPFMLTGPLMPGFRDFAYRWVFNSPAYDVALAMADASALKSLWTAVKDPLRLEAISPFVYRHLYDDFVARALLAACAAAAIWKFRRNAPASIGALLLSSPVIHPWYWLVAAPIALLEGSGVIWFALFAPFSYLLYDGAPSLTVYLLCYAAPAALIAWPRLSAIATSGAGWLRPATRFRRARGTSPP